MTLCSEGLRERFEKTVAWTDDKDGFTLQLTLQQLQTLENTLTPQQRALLAQQVVQGPPSNGSDSSQQQQQGISLYKTELCRSFTETGFCRYGMKCQFAHGRDELRQLVRHRKYKTEKCKNFTKEGTCPYGQRCRFIHDEDSRVMRLAPSSQSSVSSQSSTMSAQSAPFIPSDPPLGYISPSESPAPRSVSFTVPPQTSNSISHRHRSLPTLGPLPGMAGDTDDEFFNDTTPPELIDECEDYLEPLETFEPKWDRTIEPTFRRKRGLSMPSLVCAGDPIFKGFGMCRREIIRNGEISPPEPIGPRIKNAAYLKRSNSVCAGIDPARLSLFQNMSDNTIERLAHLNLQ